MNMYGHQPMAATPGMMAAPGMTVPGMSAPGMMGTPGMAAPGMMGTPGMAAPGMFPPAGFVNLDVDYAPGFATLDLGPGCVPPAGYYPPGGFVNLDVDCAPGFATLDVGPGCLPHFPAETVGRREYEEVVSPMVHVVRKGDTVWKLAKKHCTTMQAIILANNLRNPDLIYPGQVLVIPGASTHCHHLEY